MCCEVLDSHWSTRVGPGDQVFVALEEEEDLFFVFFVNMQLWNVLLLVTRPASGALTPSEAGGRTPRRSVRAHRGRLEATAPHPSEETEETRGGRGRAPEHGAGRARRTSRLPSPSEPQHETYIERSFRDKETAGIQS